MIFSFFSKNEIGYDCYNSEDNGAMYVPEHVYTAHCDNEPNPLKIYIPVCWPDSQKYLDWEHSNPDKFERCELINAIEEFDSNAIWVPKSLIK